jgi:hypothetical protein
MKDNLLSILALLTSLIALGTGILPRTPSSVDGEEPAAFAELNARMKRLESRVLGSTLRPSQQERHATYVEDDSPDDRASLADIQERQTRLEEQLKKYGIIERFEAHERLIEESYGTALDTNLPVKERLDALSLLRDEGRVDAAVVNAMMDVWEESAQDEKLGPYHRWALMENLRGRNEPRLRDNILSMLQDEPGAKMTGQAIAALEPMLPDPAVERWLSYLSTNGPDPKIQESATGALQRGGAQNK